MALASHPCLGQLPPTSSATSSRPGQPYPSQHEVTDFFDDGALLPEFPHGFTPGIWGKEKRQKCLGLSRMARPFMTREEGSDGRAVGQGLKSFHLWGAGMPMFRLHVRFSHQRGLLGAIRSGGPGMRAELGQKPEGWPGKGAGGVGSSLWISMSSGRLGKSRASSSRGSRPSFFIRW